MRESLVRQAQRERQRVLSRDEGRALINAQAKRKNKYGAKRTTIDGQTFDSKGEAARFQVLKRRQHIGEIAELQAQVPYPLTAPNGEVIGTYVADAVYFDCRARKWVVEDFKGGRATKTALFRWKAKHMLAEHKIAITIVESPNA
ncbi:DUF1064 domain-containing protein [Roseibium sp.]|uniref:DUF1064 domain-containing protein n=1 Tax=Roseibium sp. TaxID=1936156 RepID=UPI0032694065